MHRFLLGLFIVFVTAAVMTATTAVIPPPSAPDLNNMSPQAKSVLTTGLKMGNLNIRFEDTILGAVLKAAGVGEINQQGDAGDNILWLCYTITNTIPHERIWIVSHGEMGGEDHDIGWIIGEELPSATATPDCPILPKKLQPVSFSGKLWLGMSKTKAIQILGHKYTHKGAWAYWFYQGKVPGDCPPDGYDIENYLTFKSIANRIVYLQAGQVTSC